MKIIGGRRLEQETAGCHCNFKTTYDGFGILPPVLKQGERRGGWGCGWRLRMIDALNANQGLPAGTAAATILPVGERERVVAVDVLRGVALLGILTMNVVSFGLPFACYMDPRVPDAVEFQGAFGGLNKVAWAINFYVFDTKMMSIFSMLFGAGLALMGERADRRAAETGATKGRFAAVYYRRIGFLALFGLLHAYGLWYGDILFSYAVCGLLLYPLRRLRARWLAAIGIAMIVIGVGLSAGAGAGMTYMESQQQRAAAVAALPEATEAQKREAEGLTEAVKNMNNVGDSRAQVAQMRGSLPEVLKTNAIHAFMMQAMMLPLMVFWRCMGLMLLGMALVKRGMLSGLASKRAYVWMVGIGYGVGLPLTHWAAVDAMATDFRMSRLLLVGWVVAAPASIMMALGHVGVVMLVVKSGAIKGILARLAAVGRMAMTNYLMQTVICTTIFYGWGFGLFGSLERWQLWGVVLGVWALQLALSPVWLARFRFGPAEWAWRSLTHLRMQPMRR